MEITKGKWEIRNSIPQSSGQGDITVHTDQIIAIGINAELDLDFTAVSFCGRRGNKQAESNAILIADAGNAYQSTNKLPSELAEANKELLVALTLLLKSHRQLTFEINHNLNDTPFEELFADLIKKYSNA